MGGRAVPVLLLLLLLLLVLLGVLLMMAACVGSRLLAHTLLLRLSRSGALCAWLLHTVSWRCSNNTAASHGEL